MNNTQQTASQLIAEARKAWMNGSSNVFDYISYSEITWYHNKCYDNYDDFIIATATFISNFKNKLPIKQLVACLISSGSIDMYKNVHIVETVEYLLSLGDDKPNIVDVIKYLRGEKVFCTPVPAVIEPICIEDKSSTKLGNVLNDVGLSDIDLSMVDWKKLKGNIINCLNSILSSVADTSSTRFDEKMSKLEEDAREEIKNIIPNTEDKQEQKVTNTNTGANKNIPDSNKPFIPLNKDINIKLEDVPANYKAPRNGTIIILDESNTNMWLEEKITSADDYKSIYNDIEKCNQDGKPPLLIHILMVHYFNKHYGVNAIPYAIKEDAVYVSVGDINAVIKIPYYSNKAIRMNVHASKQPQQQTA